MFWKTDSYEIPISANPIEEVLHEYGEKEGFKLVNSRVADEYVLRTSIHPSHKSFFNITVAVKDTESKRFVRISVQPNTWLMLLIAILIVIGIYALKVDSPARKILGYAIPFTILIPYVYALLRIQKTLELKHYLIPGYLDTKEGRLETHRTSISPLTIFLNIQQYAYLTFVIVFIIIILLWMTGAVDSLNPKDWFQK